MDTRYCFSKAKQSTLKCDIWPTSSVGKCSTFATYRQIPTLAMANSFTPKCECHLSNHDLIVAKYRILTCIRIDACAFWLTNISVDAFEFLVLFWHNAIRVQRCVPSDRSLFRNDPWSSRIWECDRRRWKRSKYGKLVRTHQTVWNRKKKFPLTRWIIYYNLRTEREFSFKMAEFWNVRPRLKVVRRSFNINIGSLRCRFARVSVEELSLSVFMEVRIGV